MRVAAEMKQSIVEIETKFYKFCGNCKKTTDMIKDKIVTLNDKSVKNDLIILNPCKHFICVECVGARTEIKC